MKKQSKKNIYSQMQKFADITKILIIKGNITRAKHCMEMAEKMFNAGNTEIKNATLNVYMFSVSSFMKMHHCSIKNLFPVTLQNEYCKQLNINRI